MSENMAPQSKDDIEFLYMWPDAGEEKATAIAAAIHPDDPELVSLIISSNHGKNFAQAILNEREVSILIGALQIGLIRLEKK